MVKKVKKKWVNPDAADLKAEKVFRSSSSVEQAKRTHAKKEASSKTRKEKFDDWRKKHADTLIKIKKGSELAAAAIQEGGFTRGLGAGTGGGGMVTQGAPSSVGGDEYQDYQTASENLKKRKTNRGY
tara:strand:+ start:317 stop:697 length:381 start_codon:yes stop_codon:yes gene_type:complete